MKKFWNFRNSLKRLGELLQGVDDPFDIGNLTTCLETIDSTIPGKIIVMT